MRLGTYILELFLVQLALYLIIWLSNEYLASMLCLVFAGIFLVILLISLIVEWVERSNVPRWYYQFMVASMLAPAVSFVLYLILNQGLDWVNTG